MGYGTIRISDGAHGTLREMSRSEGKPMATLLDEAVETLRRQRFLEQVNAAYAALRGRTPPRGRSIEAERREWDATLPDGLAVAEGRSAVSRAGAPGTAAEAVVNPPARGEVWLADLNPTRGHEQAGRRPVLVVSEDLFNRGPAGLAIVLPMTSTVRDVPSHVPISPPRGGVKSRTAILCEAVRSVSVERLVVRWGAVDRQTMSAVEDRLRILMRL